MRTVLFICSIMLSCIIISCGGGGGGDVPAGSLSYSPPSIDENGDGTVGADNYDNSPFGFHPASIEKSGYGNKGYFDAQNIGVRWSRPALYAFWVRVQPDINSPDYNWNQYDIIYGGVPSGMNTLANIEIQPKTWNATSYRVKDSYLPVDEAKYTAFVKALVERYDGDGIDDMAGLTVPVKYWQAGNEPHVTMSGFAGFQRMTYLAVKDACPSCKVLIGGATGTNVTDYIDYIDRIFMPILTELNGDYADIIDFHWYGDAMGDYRESSIVYDHIKAALSSAGFAADIPVWITEMGSFSGTATTGEYRGVNQTEARQAGDYIKRYVYSLSLGIKKIFPAFGLIEGFRGIDGYFDHTGLIYDGEGDDPGLGVRKLGYYSYKLMTDTLEGARWDQVETIRESDNVYIYKFTKNGKSIFVAWWDYFNETDYSGGDIKTVALDTDFTGAAYITNAVPNADAGLNLNAGDYPDFFEKTAAQTATDGQITLHLQESPLFIQDGD
ncbi:MAG: hypothetical protein HZA16_10740 [Nitrospirae bacterium]|nr:hypothetical protein [Nitrospirota bacterium]